MIYIVVADALDGRNENINEKWDCRISRQPQSLLPSEVFEYIENTSNDKIKKERYLTYSTLSYCLREFFSIDDWHIDRSEAGKPYLIDNSGGPLLCSDVQKICVSLSHSEGMAAVALSNEGEIGIDIQSEVEKTIAKRLEKRFLQEIEPKNDELKINYFYLKIDGGEWALRSFEPKIDDRCDFLTKWTFAESVIKCFGLTFSEISKINEISKNTRSQTVCVNNCKITATIRKK